MIMTKGKNSDKDPDPGSGKVTGPEWSYFTAETQKKLAGFSQRVLAFRCSPRLQKQYGKLAKIKTGKGISESTI
jgi:hypothetical protein